MKRSTVRLCLSKLFLNELLSNIMMGNLLCGSSRESLRSDSFEMSDSDEILRMYYLYKDAVNDYKIVLLRNQTLSNRLYQEKLRSKELMKMLAEYQVNK